MSLGEAQGHTPTDFRIPGPTILGLGRGHTHGGDCE